jgi:hypothetical protein
MVDRHIALAAAGFVIAGQNGDPFEQCGFARAVLADNDGDGAIEGERELVTQKRQAKWIGLRIRHTGGVKPKPPEIGCRQVDVTFAS